MWLTRGTPTHLRAPASRSGYDTLLRWGRQFTDRTWAVERTHSLDRHLAQFLLANREVVVDVPAFLSAGVRELSRGGRRKTDAIDALAKDRAAATTTSCTRW